MATETAQVPANRPVNGDTPEGDHGRLATADAGLLGGVLLFAAANFAWQLGSSSYFVDEALSLEHALPHISSLITVVNQTETTPWTFFLFLHEWLYRIGSHSEWVTRAPSAIAGVALVAAVYWAARVFLSARAAIGAAALTAASPLVLDYAQQVRVYVFVMLAVTIAVGATVRGARRGDNRAWMLVFGAGASVIALWLHYTAILVVGPLCVWVAMQRGLGARAKGAFVGACVLAAGAELPLFIKQYHYAPNGGVGAAGGLRFGTVMDVAGTPFDSRVPTGTDWLLVLGVLVVIAALAVLVLRASQHVNHRRLLAVLAAAAPVGIFVLGVAGKDVVIRRYTAVAAPLLIIAIAAAVASLPRLCRLGLAVAAAVPALVGLVRSHQTTGFYAPAKETIAYIHTHGSAQTPIVTPGSPGSDIPLAYYRQRLPSPMPPIVSASDHSVVLQLLRERRPVWFVSEIPAGSASLHLLYQTVTLVLKPYHYRPAQIHAITTTTTFVATLATPTGG